VSAASRELDIAWSDEVGDGCPSPSLANTPVKGLPLKQGGSEILAARVRRHVPLRGA